MRILCTSQASAGHLHPLIPLALALAEAGHDVRFACARSVRQRVERLGFVSFGAGAEEAESAIRMLRGEMASIPYADRAIVNHQRGWIGAFAPPMIRDLLAAVETWRPDVFVRDSSEYGAYIAADLLGVPHVGVRTTALSASWDRRHVLGPALDNLRSAWGLPPDPDVQGPFRHLQLVFGPPDFCPVGETLGPTTRVLRPAIFDRLDEEPLPARVRDLPDRPTVYATLGTVFNTPDVLRVVLKAVRDLPVNVIATTGPGHDPAQFGPQPAHVHVERYVAQSLLFPRCDLVVAHGGYNTVVAAIEHALPMVLLPVSADQPENAAWCAAAGVAQVIPPPHQSAPAIREAIVEALRRPEYRANARRVADAMRQQPGMERAVELVEHLARASSPLAGLHSVAGVPA